ncbi:MAG: ribonuclease Z [Deltaproteobacteria bacterium]|nr:ribonuclease Z [Deltaproteobacteria bacterium]
MSGFEVIVLGVGDTFTDKHRTTAALLHCDGFYLAIDCPDTYRSVLRSAVAIAGRELSLADIDHFLITHVHGDHMNGLEGVAFFKRFAENKRVRLVTSPEVRSVIWDQRLTASMSTLWDGQQYKQLGFDDYFEHVPLSWTDAITVGPFTIRARRTVHHIPTSALFIEAGGRTLGWSSDTAFDPALIAFLEPADLIIHETNLGPAHTSYASLAALPEALRAKMRLNHYTDSFDTAASNIACLREGQVLQP